MAPVYAPRVSSLGCLLSEALNIRLRRVGSGRRHTFTNPGEIALDTWMAKHARVAWTPGSGTVGGGEEAAVYGAPTAESSGQ